MTHVAIEAIEMKTAMVLDRDNRDELRDFDFTASSTTTRKKAAFRDFLDTTITESLSFGEGGKGTNREDYQFCARDYLTSGGPFGSLTDTAIAWIDDIVEEDDPMDAVSCLRADLEDFLANLDRVCILFNRYLNHDLASSKAA